MTSPDISFVLFAPGGTIKADLFASWTEAKGAARRWRAELNERRCDDWLENPSKASHRRGRS